MRARFAAIAVATLLSACATERGGPPAGRPTELPPVVPAPQPQPVPAPPANALAAGVTFAAARSQPATEAWNALNAFRRSCPALLRRTDQSGLTQVGDWVDVCAEAQAVSDGTAASAFFRDRFDWLQVGDGKAFATGYYEPEIRGSRVRAPGFDVPIYAVPSSLIRCTRADGTTGRGRIDDQGQCVAFHARAAIEDGALASETPIAWAADPIDLFFLQIQGSGRLHLPDGSVMRIGYADQNGQPYVAIGRVLRDRGVFESGKATMDGIIGWMRRQSDGGKSLMRENPSYIFFRELTGPGPLGAMNVPVTPQVTVAADPKFTPLGAPVFLALDAAPVGHFLWVAQDTGGAIKGANRFDTFWGAGEQAKAYAGPLSASGRALILVPKTAGSRLVNFRAQARP